MRKLFDNILTLCRKWESDKWVHVVLFIIVSWFFATIASAIGVFIEKPLARPIAGLVGVAFGSAFSIWKECFDKRTEGLFDEQDLVASFSGVAIFYIIYCV